jgi:hypothetical protein
MSEIIAYASTSEFRKNHLMSAAQYKNALSKNVVEFDIPLVAKSDLDKHRALIETLQAAVKFYAEAWCFTTNPKRPGLEWKPKEALLDDCGNVARAALAAAKEQGQ